MTMSSHVILRTILLSIAMSLYMHIFAAAILVSCNLIFLQGVHSVKLIFSGALHIYIYIQIYTYS